MSRRTDARPRTVGVRIPTQGSGSELELVRERVLAVEKAGFASAWISDHLVIPAPADHEFPFSRLGMSPPQAGGIWLDAITALAALAASTTTLHLGVAALVAGLRPVPIAVRQVRTVHILAGNRMEIGLAAGWLTEEFSVLGQNPVDRWRCLDAWRNAADGAWGDAGLEMPPLLVAGNGPTSRNRVTVWGDGWLPQQHVSSVDIAWLAACVDEVDASWAASGRAHLPRIVLRLSGKSRAEVLHELVLGTLRAGVDEVVIDGGWDGAALDPGVLALTSVTTTI